MFVHKRLCQAQFWRAVLAGQVPGSPSLQEAGQGMQWLSLPPSPSGSKLHRKLCPLEILIYIIYNIIYICICNIICNIIYICICICMDTHRHTHTHIYIYICIHICVCSCSSSRSRGRSLNCSRSHSSSRRRRSRSIGWSPAIWGYNNMIQWWYNNGIESTIVHIKVYLMISNVFQHISALWISARQGL